MMELGEAIAAAEEYAKSIYNKKLMNLLVEEVELSDNEEAYFITLGWDEIFRDMNSVILPKEVKRLYKVFIVDRVSGKVEMKMRE